MGTDKEKSLYYLDELSNYKVANNDKDVRGWIVKDKDARVVGKVANLLVNKNTERVVYLDLEVDTSIIDANYEPFSTKAQDGVHGFLNEKGENHLILPIGLVHLNLESEIVFTEAIDYKTFAETKRIKKGSSINRDYEISILNSYKRNHTNEYLENDEFYDRSEFENQ